MEVIRIDYLNVPKDLLKALVVLASLMVYILGIKRC